MSKGSHDQLMDLGSGYTNDVGDGSSAGGGSGFSGYFGMGSTNPSIDGYEYFSSDALENLIAFVKASVTTAISFENHSHAVTSVDVAMSYTSEGRDNDRPFGTSYDQKKSKDEKLTADDVKNIAEKVARVGTGLEIIDALDKSLGNNTKIFGNAGRIGGWLANGGKIVYDGVEYFQGKISGYKFSFRLGTTLTSVVVGAEVGAAFGGPAGLVTGTIIGLGGELIEDASNKVMSGFSEGLNQFMNQILSNIKL